jgi:hypothetical protein
MTDDNPTMRFGKYKDRPVAEVMASDPSYIQWLTLQPWFVDKYKPTYNFIVQGGAVSDMSPEHNALQVLFLDDDFCVRVARAVLNLKTLWEEMVRSCKAQGRPTSESLSLSIIDRRMEEVYDVAFTLVARFSTAIAVNDYGDRTSLGRVLINSGSHGRQTLRSPPNSWPITPFNELTSCTIAFRPFALSSIVPSSEAMTDFLRLRTISSERA